MVSLDLSLKFVILNIPPILQGHPVWTELFPHGIYHLASD